MPDPFQSERHQRPRLTVRQIRFCQNYANTGKGYQSYLDAGFPPGVSRDATDKAMARLARKPGIIEYIRELQNQAADEARVTVARVVQGLADSAFADRTMIFNDDGTIRPPSQWPEALRSIIAGVEVEEEIEDRAKVSEGGGVEYAPVRVRKWKVKFERSLEAKKILAQWLRMVGKDVTIPGGDEKKNPLVIEVELGPDKVLPPHEPEVEG
jgi:phage terminase small subunit